MKIRPHRALSNKQLELIGCIVLQHTALDFSINRLLMGLIGIDEATSQVVIYRENLSRKIEWVKKIAEKRYSTSDQDKLKDALDKIAKCERNLIAHGIIAYENESLENPVIINLGRGTSKPLTDELLQTSLTLLEETTDYMLAQANLLIRT